ncbi:response regulator [Saccharibacillus sp. CPCC 101409]|uniref:response regulator transcription factor n=1 Tax=Saccharibacillus sp. CPCC 101409 TaxID=3058041 RepID=UPI0026715348|nr:response regulator [Saccharibacillus sp. CPCC 101409]MDO3412463.1 response regulator [Saccharibacillus sp. CPCC 101409]
MNGRMLVVDDEALFRQGFIHLVRNNPLGWDVIGEAADGEEALAAVRSDKPDLIVTDISMPVMDGLDLARRIQEEDQDILIIILTGYREFEYAQRALRYGAIEFLLKPFSLDEACQVLRKAHERYRRRQSEQRLRSEYGRTDRTERWRGELAELLLKRQVGPMRARVAEGLEEAARMELADCKAEVQRMLRAIEELPAQQFNVKPGNEPGKAEEFGGDPLLWMHSVQEVTDWARGRSGERLELLESLLEDRRGSVVHRVIQYVEAHYAETCTLQSAADYAHVTPNYLSHLFKKETGEGFSQYVSRRRIEKAKLLLRETRQSMSSIAEQTGFDTSSYFTTVFKQLTGMSPRAFRKQAPRSPHPEEQ